MARKKKEECPSVPSWIISFSDLMSLLLTFFILLYSMSVLDIKKLMKFLWYFQGEEKFEAIKTVQVIPPISLMRQDMAKLLRERIERILPPHAFQIAVIEDYILIRLFNDITFEQDSAKLTSRAKKALQSIATVIKSLEKSFSEILIEGHANKNEKNPWEISKDRALTIAQYLISLGLDPKKMSITAYGNTRPLYTWNHPLLIRRNSRVEIKIKLKQIRDDVLKDINSK
ncbi:MAG: flagellar motor protein MotB [Aquificae bacterium]|nr:flagellar motor protein MotB [Aquificota bacterium]